MYFYPIDFIGKMNLTSANLNKLWTPVLFAVFLCSGNILFAQQQQKDGPNPLFDEALQYDFGEILEGEEAYKIFRFVNQ